MPFSPERAQGNFLIHAFTADRHATGLHGRWSDVSSLFGRDIDGYSHPTILQLHITMKNTSEEIAEKIFWRTTTHIKYMLAR